MAILNDLFKTEKKSIFFFKYKFSKIFHFSGIFVVLIFECIISTSALFLTSQDHQYFKNFNSFLGRKFSELVSKFRSPPRESVIYERWTWPYLWCCSFVLHLIIRVYHFKFLNFLAGGGGIHRKVSKTNKSATVHAGSDFKAKKASGDMKRKGKPDPYAYIPLSRNALNRRFVICMINLPEYYVFFIRIKTNKKNL